MSGVVISPFRPAAARFFSADGKGGRWNVFGAADSTALPRFSRTER
jgi:hypothetical protein